MIIYIHNSLFHFKVFFQIHKINTRNRHHLRPQFPASECQKRFVLYCGCFVWNDLPDHIKNITNKDTFKINAKKRLLTMRLDLHSR